MRPIPLVLAALLLTSCAPPELDMASNEAYEQSLQRISESLDDVGKKELEVAMGVILVAAMEEAATTEADQDENQRRVDARLRKMMDGRTAEEIVKVAAGIRQSHRQPLELAKKG